MRTTKTRIAFKFCNKALTTILAALAISINVSAQYGTGSGEWPSYGGDTGSTKYSPLNQINPQNFEELEVAWTWTSIDADLDLEAIHEFNESVRINNFQGTPLMVDGTLYIITAVNQIAALDPATGETLWSYNPEVYVGGLFVNYICLL